MARSTKPRAMDEARKRYNGSKDLTRSIRPPAGSTDRDSPRDQRSAGEPDALESQKRTNCQRARKLFTEQEVPVAADDAEKLEGVHNTSSRCPAPKSLTDKLGKDP